ncbi:hypothetical protein F751_3197 [Auxenochlorella protothecoides]|uniref:Uncharacterized protein n=1 Tax=Auxenochlorella protothecoides TaxID=3075 RepID=A0A087SFH5_AUXPR|nr:hypothetical protein F751_3197 [Auxenochlorella protothecoides]KFM24479.1 hypothetical protein F751_3197 [Auxenochlorella protothecoides]
MATHVTGFKHTQYAIYLVITFSAACVLIDSAQGVVERFNLNRRWYYLFGATCLFAYLYVRPQINLRLGSAAGAQISWSSLYILWLCSAVFYHLPSLDSLGIDLRADLSILLTTFLLSLAVLGAAAAAHAAALALAWVRPWLAHPSAASVGGTISPIFSLWLTLVAMLGATCLSDYAAASAMHAAASLARRKALAAEQRRSRRVLAAQRRPELRPAGPAGAQRHAQQVGQGVGYCFYWSL